VPDTLGTIAVATEISHRLPADQLEWMAQRVAELTKPTDEILTSDEAAAFLRCSKAQLSKLVNGGGLPAIKLDAYNRFLKSDLLAYAERHRQIDEVAA
jgi:excisionase family DNA binding protein